MDGKDERVELSGTDEAGLVTKEPGTEQGAAPHAVRRAWELQRGDSGNADKGLNARKVVRAAAALADRDGLKGLSIRKLSQQLGVTPMALYRHVESRDELLLLMVDDALGPPPDALARAEDWQEALRRWGEALFGRYRLHPWLLDVPAFSLPTTPNHIHWVEAFLAAMVHSGLTLQRQLDAALLIDGHARYIAHLQRLRDEYAPGDPAVPPSTWLRSLLDPTTLPHFSAVLDAGVLENDSGPDLSFGLDCIIDGLTSRLPQ